MLPPFDPVKLKEHRLQQASLGFPLLRGCPNTYAISLMLSLDALAKEERMGFAEELTSMEEAQAAHPPESITAQRDLMRSFPLITRLLGRNLGLVDPQPHLIDMRCMPVKVLSSVLKEAGSGGLDQIARTLRLSDDPLARLPAQDHATTLEEMVPAPPALLRKLMDRMMKHGFGAEAQRLDKTDVLYEVPWPGGQLRLNVSYAQGPRLLQQFNYHLGIAVKGRPGMPMLSYESVWRVPGMWNYLTETNAERSIAHLRRLIIECLGLV